MFTCIWAATSAELPCIGIGSGGLRAFCSWSLESAACLAEAELDLRVSRICQLLVAGHVG